MELFGKESYVAYTYDNIRRYEYLFDKKTFASFGFSENKKLVEVEIIFDKDMAMMFSNAEKMHQCFIKTEKFIH